MFEASRTDSGFHQKSAIKIIGPLKERAIREYKNEIDSMNSLNSCANVVHIGDCSVIELVDELMGKTKYYLAIRMELLAPIPTEGWDEKKVIKLGSDICKALEYCHNCEPPIIHCDIKPSNILVGQDGNYRLADFGQARSLRNTGTTTGFHGTPSYMSPEMFSHRGYDTRSDLYSLGYTMYALLNDGMVPFEKEVGIDEAMRLKQTERSLPKIKRVSKGMHVILQRLCHFKKEERFQSAEELLRVLNASEKEKRESKSHLHTRRRFIKGLTTVLMIWLIAVSAAMLAIYAVKWGEALFFDRELEGNTVVQQEVVSEADDKELRKKEAAEIIRSRDVEMESEAESKKDNSTIPADRMTQKLTEYCISLGWKQGEGKYRVNAGDPQSKVPRWIGEQEEFQMEYDKLISYINAYYTYSKVDSFTIDVRMPSRNYVDTAFYFDIVFWSDTPQ